MHNIFYFSHLTFMPQPLCLPIAFDPLQTNFMTLAQETHPRIIEKENSQINFLGNRPGEMVQREAESARFCLESKLLLRPQKNLKNFHGKQQEDEYKLRPSTSNAIVYKKKNTESNIINQVFSFLCKEKSRSEVCAYFKGDEDKANNYYAIMSRIKKNNKKYINRKFIKKLIEPKDGLLLQRSFARSRNTLIQITEVRKLLRVLIFRFFRDYVNCNLLTSCKIYKSTLSQHFWRKREILAFLFGWEREQQ